MGRPKVEPRDAVKRVDIRMSVDDLIRLRYAFEQTTETSISEWLRPQILAMADRVIAEAGRTIEFGRTAPGQEAPVGRKADGKARSQPRRAS
jgi:hypothetical protein